MPRPLGRIGSIPVFLSGREIPIPLGAVEEGLALARVPGAGLFDGVRLRAGNIPARFALRLLESVRGDLRGLVPAHGAFGRIVHRQGVPPRREAGRPQAGISSPEIALGAFGDLALFLRALGVALLRHFGLLPAAQRVVVLALLFGERVDLLAAAQFRIVLRLGEGRAELLPVFHRGTRETVTPAP